MRFYLKFIFLIVLILLTMFQVSAVNENKSVKVTYIANEGFLIEKGKKKILIDGLFGQKDFGFCEIPSKSVLQNIIDGENKFTDINIVLASHSHRDHFYAPFVEKYLNNNERTIFLSTKQSIDKLKDNNKFGDYDKRIINMTPINYSTKRFEKDGIKISAYRLAHSPYIVEDKKTGEKYNKHKDIINLGFLIEINGVTIFHGGDSNYQSCYDRYNLNKENIDIAFLPPVFLVKDKGLDVIKKNINPKKIIVMHLKNESIADIVNYINKIKEKGLLLDLSVFNNKMDSKNFKF